MRILFINNVSTERCGVRTFGEQMVNALNRAGDAVTVWDGTYSAVKQFGYLPHEMPTQFKEFDLVHLNWDPQAINHYLPEHFAGGPPLSLFLHDVPPNSTCPVYGVAAWRFGFEPYGDVDVIDEPIPPTPTGLDPVPNRVVIGVSGIRNDAGAVVVQQLCKERGWECSIPSWQRGSPWLSTNDEIRRLARCTVNVCWYATSGRGKSMAAAFCCAARRPLICSGSTMFSALWPYEDEIYFPARFGFPEHHADDWATQLPILVDEVLRDLKRGEELIPNRVCYELSWDQIIQRVRMRWRGVR